jgi:hypothetical protein
MDVSMSGGRVTDPQGHAAATSLVTAGTVLLGSVLLAAAQADLRAVAASAAAGAMSVRELHGHQRRLDAANKPVEDAVRVIRDQLDLPAPDTS